MVLKWLAGILSSINSISRNGESSPKVRGENKEDLNVWNHLVEEWFGWWLVGGDWCSVQPEVDFLLAWIRIDVFLALSATKRLSSLSGWTNPIEKYARVQTVSSPPIWWWTCFNENKYLQNHNLASYLLILRPVHYVSFMPLQYLPRSRSKMHVDPMSLAQCIGNNVTSVLQEISPCYPAGPPETTLPKTNIFAPANRPRASKGNSSEPTTIFQGWFVSFRGGTMFRTWKSMAKEYSIHLLERVNFGLSSGMKIIFSGAVSDLDTRWWKGLKKFQWIFLVTLEGGTTKHRTFCKAKDIYNTCYTTGMISFRTNTLS